MKLPAGLAPVEGSIGWGFAAPEARGWVEQALQRGEMLRSVAAAHPDPVELVGRGPVHALPAPDGGRWVVRPYLRGGLLAAPLLGDRHLRVGTPRPVAEAKASAEVGARSVRTPRVVAGAVYPWGAFYRADIVTEYIPASRDLAAALFATGRTPASERSALLDLAGGLLGRLARAGIEHRDLNARNILVVREGEALVALLLDLDRCRLRPRGIPISPARMLARLERSLRKISQQRSAPLMDEEWAALRRAVPVP